MTVRDSLPPVALDLARSCRDRCSPSRRRALSARRAHVDRLARAVSADGSVLAGPFAGVRLPLRGSWGGFAARLAGTYELELQPHLEAAIAARPTLVIDAGAADGYYAAGLARALPDARVEAYDLDPLAREVCREAAALNAVTNLKVGGRITPGVLARRLRPAALLLCDVEGYESALLVPDRIPALRATRVICELHEFIVQGVTEEIVSRFSSTHRIDLVSSHERVQRPPQLAHLDESAWREAVQEGRPAGMQWAVMVPR